MRDIKFRAYSVLDNKMWNDVQQFKADKWKIGKDNIKIMQNIGTKDINDIEIFEGDICDFGEFDEYIRGVIQWDEASCGFKFFYDESTYFHLDDEPYEEMRIIGNRFQNKDLIEWL